ncbi:unnamed protein product [Soboliphyme baturini]|uniref:DUF736 domain-containing protein n=1 Tax=Soboliphyme baturini TaxID=241478 RepID=A0A183IBN6_9BILA|nr:unnamed protein product [Soboliphyme baturini]
MNAVRRSRPEVGLGLAVFENRNPDDTASSVQLPRTSYPAKQAGPRLDAGQWPGERLAMAIYKIDGDSCPDLGIDDEELLQPSSAFGWTVCRNRLLLRFPDDFGRSCHRLCCRFVSLSSATIETQECVDADRTRFQ